MDKVLYDQFYELEDKHWWFTARREIILDLVKRFKPAGSALKILDIGCGTGAVLQKLKEYGDVSGVDFSSEAVSYAIQKVGGNIVRGSLPTDIPFAPASFDLITLLDVLEHIDDDAGSIVTVNKILKDNGILIMTVPAFQFLWSGHDDINHHKRRYTKSEIHNLLVKHGFKILKISYFNTFLFPAILTVRLLGKVFKMNNQKSDLKMPGKIPNAILKRIFSAEQLWLSRMRFPVGVSILAVAKKEAR